MWHWLQSASEKREQKTAFFTLDTVTTLMCKSFEECQSLLSLCLGSITTWHCHSGWPDRPVLLGAVENVRSTEEGSPARVLIYCPTCALLFLGCCFSWPLKRNSTEVDLNHSLGQGHRGVLHELHQTHRPAPESVPASARYCDRHTDHINQGSDQQVLPWRMKVWLVSSKMSQPSTIILSMARFFRMFSVSLTSSCITL